MKQYQTPKDVTNPIILFGTGRSGTTILNEVLFRHGDIAFPSQYNNRFPHILSVNYIRYVFDNPLWRVHGKSTAVHGTSFLDNIIFKPVEAYDLWRFLTRPEIDFPKNFLMNQKADARQGSFIRQYAAKCTRKQGRKRFACKITGPSRIGFLLSIFPDAKFVRILRNPVPVISSFLKVDFWQDRATRLWWKGAYSDAELETVRAFDGDPLLFTAFQVKKLMDVTDAEIKQHSPDLLTVRYESFVLNPAQVATDVFGFLELPEDRACIDYLAANQIVDRNRPDESYFCKEELKKNYQILEKKP